MQTTKARIYTLFVLILAGLFLYNSVDNGDVESKFMNRLSKDTTASVFQQKMYFGHQSVGNNILHGISLIAPDRVAQIIDLQDMNDQKEILPALYHSRVGANLDPKKKINDFRKALTSGLSGQLDMAFLKLCYLDVKKETNVDELFVSYKTSFAALKKEFPNIVFVHFTMPLTTNNDSWKTQIKKILGQDDLWEYADNIKRNQYNQLLVNEYQGKEPVFDLAAIESTRPDGQRESFSFKGKEYYALAKEYSRDGGHLNEIGSQVVATALLEFLAGI